MPVLAHVGHVLVDVPLFGGPVILLAAFFGIVHLKGGLGALAVDGDEEGPPRA
jgi:hypothetical protein